jgi:hypothetical protein
MIKKWFNNGYIYHTLRGIIVGSTYFMMYNSFGFSKMVALIVSFVLVVGISLATEIYQKEKKRGVFDIYDIVSDIVGWFILVIIFGQFLNRFL